MMSVNVFDGVFAWMALLIIFFERTFCEGEAVHARSTKVDIID